MTSPTLNDNVLMRTRAKRAVREFKPKLWLDGASGVSSPGASSVASGARGFTGETDNRHFVLAAKPNPGAADFWVACWMNPAELAANAFYTVIYTGGNGNTSSGFWLNRRGAFMRFAFNGTVNSAPVVTQFADKTMSIGTWYYVLLVVDRTANTATCYVDGVASATVGDLSSKTTEACAPTASFNSSIGSYAGGLGYAQSGAMSRIVYGTTLPTAAEREELYGNGAGKLYAELSAGLAAKVVYAWNCNEASGNLLSAATANTGTASALAPTISAGPALVNAVDTGAVSQWTSRDVAHVGFGQGLLTKRPTRTTATQAVTFAGTNDTIAIASPILTGTLSRVVALVKTTDVAAQQVVYSQSDKDAAAVYCQLGISSGNYIHYKFNNGGTADELRGNIQLGTGWHVLEWAVNADHTKILCRVDGEPDDLTVVGGANNGSWFADLTNDDNTTIGAVVLSSTAGSFLVGSIREIVALEALETWGNDQRLRTTVGRHGGRRNYAIAAEGFLDNIATLAGQTRTVYTNVLYSYNATLIAAGATDYSIFSESHSYVAGALNQAQIDAMIVAHGAGTKPIMWNDETKNMSVVSQRDQFIADYITILTAWQASSSRPHFFYCIVPHLNYWGTILHAGYAENTLLHEQGVGITSRWQDENDVTMAALGGYLSLLCPYGYQGKPTSASGFTQLKSYGLSNAAEAVRVAGALPVMPVIGYHINTHGTVGTQWAAAGAFVQATGVLTPTANPGWTISALIGKQVRLGATNWYTITANSGTTLTCTGTLPANGNYDWEIGGHNMTEAEWITYLKYMAALPDIGGLIMWEGVPAPTAYDFTTALLALMAGTGDFADT